MSRINAIVWIVADLALLSGAVWSLFHDQLPMAMGYMGLWLLSGIKQNMERP